MCSDKVEISLREKLTMIKTTSTLKDLSSGPVTITGWVDSIRKQKKFSFLVIRDGVTKQDKVQVCVNHVLMSAVPEIREESYVLVKGTARTLPESKTSFRNLEIEADSLVIIGDAKNDFPSRCPSDAGPNVKLDERHLYLRNPHFRLVTKLRSILVKALREHFEKRGATEIFPPHFVGNSCEGGATLFNVKYPARESGEIDSYLTQSSQFYLEFCLPGLGDTFCITPSFRAERSHTRRHLCEFLHAEVEYRDIYTLEDHLDKLRTLMQDTVELFLKYGRAELEELGLVEHVEEQLRRTKDIMIMTHREAVDYCREKKIYKDPETETHFEYDDDIPEMQERQIVDEHDRIIFLTKFPTCQKSFYMKRDPDNPDVALGVDCLCPDLGETIGSGVRVSDADELRERLISNGLNPEDYREYIELREYGHAHTSGMGLGVDRMLTWLLKSENIRQVVTFPRVPGRLFP